MESVERRARVHAALGEPARLAIVDRLVAGDASPGELGAAIGMGTNLLAHHLRVLQDAGVVRRVQSEGDRRRAYVQLRLDDPLVRATVGRRRFPSARRVVFVCTHNSARSQLAAAAWGRVSAVPVASAGTHPAARVHPQAVAAGRRHGLSPGQVADRARGGHRPATATWSSRCATSAHEELEPGAAAAALVHPRPGASRHRRRFRRRLRRDQPPDRRPGGHRHITADGDRPVRTADDQTDLGHPQH